MKQYLFIIFISVILTNNVLARNLICKNNDNSTEIKIFYDQDKIKTLGKTFSDIFVFGNGMSGKFYSYKSLPSTNEKKVDEIWEIDLEFRTPKTAVLSKFKYFKDQPKKISKNYYICSQTNK